MLHQMRAWAKYIWLFVIALPFVIGFLCYQTSGIGNTATITANTAVAKVNGHEISYTLYLQTVQTAEQSQQQQRPGHTLTEDERRQIENSVFDEMVTSVLLNQEYARRGITVTDDEIREYARLAPPPEFQSAPELQTNGQFDIAKYQRLLASPGMRQSGELARLEEYYREEIPKQKLLEQLWSGTFVTDADLWRAWRDAHDSAQVTYAEWSNAPDSNDTKAVTEAEMHAYYDAHPTDSKRVGHAVLSIVEIPRVITPADSAAVREHALKLRAEIVGGASFADVAKRESQDSTTASEGGNLGKGAKGRFASEPDLEKAVNALKPGEVSAPILTHFGYHLIKVDERKGDTTSVRHILLLIQPSDSNASRTDSRADTLSQLAANADQPAKLDSAASKLGLTIFKVDAVENQPAILRGKEVPSVSAWAFGGATKGDVSELYDSDEGYFMARLDSLVPGGQQSYEAMQAELRYQVAAQHHLDRMMTAANTFAAAASKSGLDVAAKDAGITLQKTAVPFTRASLVPGLGGQFTQAVGTAFGLPVGAVSAPIRDETQITVLRVDHRVTADSAAWLKQRDVQRSQRTDQLHEQRRQTFMQDLHDSAKIDDRRKQLQAAARRTTG